MGSKDTVPMPHRSQADTKPKLSHAIAARDRRTLAKLDRRGAEYRRYEEIRGAIVSDLGGSEVVSTSEAQLADKAAFIAMTLETMQIASLSGEEIDLHRYGELTDRLRRLLVTVGLRRRAREIEDTIESVAREWRESAVCS